MPVMGGYNQGTPIPHSDVEPDDAGTPTRAVPAGTVPAGTQHIKEDHKTVGRSGQTAH